MLSATKVAGQPGSHFHVPSLERWLTVFGLDQNKFASRQEARRATFEAAIVRGMGDTKIFGLRMQRRSFQYFMEQLALLSPDRMSDAERIEAMFGETTFVHLTRPDRVDQAISRLRAEQTGLWHRRSDGSDLERLSPPKESHYDAELIASHIGELTALDAAWERWFEQQALEPLRINYDKLSDDPQGILAQFLSAIHLDPKKAEFVETPTAKLADDTSRKWRERFLQEEGYVR
jgi:LPS sulfotransferase NodH